MSRVSSALWLSTLAVSTVLGTGCIETPAEATPTAEAGVIALPDEPAASLSEQAATPKLYVFRSVSIPGQVIDVLFPSSGALVRLNPANITTQQRWQFTGTQLRYNTQPNLCLQPETAAVGARLILRPCVTPSADSLQDWSGHLTSNGTVVSWRNNLTHLWIDASAGAFGLLRMQPETHTIQQDFQLASN